MKPHAASQGSQATIAQAQIIVFALMAGVVLFATVAYVVSPMGGEPELGEAVEPAVPALTAILAGQGLAAVTAAFILRGVLAQRVKPRSKEALAEVAEGVMPTELMTASIVSSALVESFGLFGCVGYLLEANVMYLAAPMISVALMAFWLPSRSSIENWVQSLTR